MAVFIHYRLAASQSEYTSFCDISAHLSCDAVLGSSYAKVLGIPVAGWAIGAYVALAGLALALASARGDARLRVASGFAALSGSVLAVSLYFLFVSTVMIGVACPLCLGLDVVNAALFVVAILVVRSLRGAAGPGWPSAGGFAATGAATLAIIAALVVLQFPHGSSASTGLSVDQVRDNDPKFYAWYISQPIVDASQLAGRHAEGPESAPITVIEFSDFECPHCGHAFVDLTSALQTAGKEVRLFYRHFPLNSDCNPQIHTRLHEHACLAAVAAECAGAQGKFWPYERLLFQHQDSLDQPSLLGFAARLSLDQAEFERCLTSPAAAAAVAEDVAAGAAAGVTSTPTFFINGRRVAGSLQDADQYGYSFAIERARLANPQAAKPAPPGN
jgi:protein-disulfide isomerase